ncbi:sulfatase [Photobacterium gaetbulicola]|uniref:Sulfatase n=1 Tax=Photobacterium gaetbulicola TaxID=1295392 RepID=A0A0B9H656_9GAMM|nr:sulfatase [Photobacterium gaetbulicola]KHT64382.1 sulfatase [Photobacterium gaetbulicola]
MFVVDDLNDWIEPMNGHPNTKTPNISRLASEATLFENAQAPAPLCGPSRTAVLTGHTPSETGIYMHIEDDKIRLVNDLTANSVFMSQYFKMHGYYTVGIGKIFHQGAAPGSFDVYGGRGGGKGGFGPKPEKRMNWDKKGTQTDWGPFPEKDEMMPDYEAAQWLKEQLSMKHDKPFFLVGGFLRPHVPWHVPQKWFDMHPVEDLVTPPYLANDLDDVPEIAKQISYWPSMPSMEWVQENDQWKNIIQAYLASITFVDSCIGTVLDALENSEYADNTAIVLWGDNGYHLGEKGRFSKGDLWERSTRAPLIIKPAKNAKKQTVSKPVNLMDIYPTMVSLAGLPKNHTIGGNDLSSLIENPNIDWPYPSLTTYGPNNHALKDERYRYIRYEDGSEELYDHSNDENEWTNLANNPAFDDVKARLRTHVPTEHATWTPYSGHKGNEYFTKLTEEARQVLELE